MAKYFIVVVALHALIGRLTPGAHAGDLDPTLAGTWPGYSRGPAYHIAVQGNRAYLANGRLFIFDISNPARPVMLGAYDDSSGCIDVRVAGN